MSRRPYGSIESNFNGKFLSKLVRENKTKGEWVVTEKIHGANFCMKVESNGNITCSRRKDILTEQEFFYNWKELRNKYSESAIKIYNSVTKDLGEEEKGQVIVRLYGELYGGYFPVIGTEENCVRVQKGIYYCPHNDFIVFDIHTSHNGFTTFHEMVELCTPTDLRHTEPLMFGSFEQVMEYNPLFPTLLPSVHGMDILEDNITEGVVIKPVESRFTSNGKRVIIKKKNEKFAEITGTVKQKQKTFRMPDSGSPLYKELYESIGRYINQNRLESVLSKLSEVSSKDTAKLAGLLSSDALVDFQKLEEGYSQLTQKEAKMLKASCFSLSLTVVNSYFDDDDKDKQ